MTNREVADVLSQTASLMELHLENDFKLKAYRNAAFAISKLDSLACEMDVDGLSMVKGIGKSIAGKVVAICSTGQLEELSDLLAKTPSGILELLDVKGLGPKKVAALWRGLDIQSPGELLYACNENRLVALKGFGEKTQAEIKKNLEFLASQKGYYHYAKAERFLKGFLELLQELQFNHVPVTSGEFRRCCEVVKEIQLITSASSLDVLQVGVLLRDHGFELSAIREGVFEIKSDSGPPILLKSDGQNPLIQFTETGPKSHVEYVTSKLVDQAVFTDEPSIYAAAGLAYIQPEMRDLEDCFQVAERLTGQDLITVDHLKGCLHNHSTYSDGGSTVREMAQACIGHGLQYLAMCDHSRSAFYAGGLSVDDVFRQQSEIDALNRELYPFRIFKGIESDILPDGSLDYPEEVLKSFDLIVASVHSGLSMSEEKATERLIKAVENPYTSILGHPTGRLLLSRKGYPIDHRKVLEACASNGVAVELNAHPYRLDLDWRYLQMAMELNVLVSINPDAHHTSGIDDMRYGVLVARKAGTPASAILNAKSLADFEKWLGL